MNIWQQNWRIGLLPSLSITGFVILARLLGVLQPLEWKALDLSLRWRLAEATDSRVTIVAITEDDIQTALDYPISDQALAALIQTIQAYDPRTIGVDIFRDKPVGEGYTALESTLQAADNVIAINKIHDTPVQPPPMLPEAQIGFADANLDDDGFLRRSLLADEDNQGDYRFSLTIRLVEQYLAAEGLILENGIRDPETMRFGETEIPRFQTNTGGYVRTNNGGNQTLINFRAGAQPFSKVSYQELISGQVDAELLQDRVVLVGYTAESVKDFVSSVAIATNSPSLIPGVEVQAHAISQILSAVYDGRPFLRAIPDGLDYIAILGGGLLGMALAYWRRKPTLHLLVIILVSVTWLLFCYALLLASWWLPLIPVTAAFLLNAVALYPFYQTQALLRSQIEDRQKLIDWAYNTIHNSPLQTLSKMLSTWPQNEPAPAAMRQDLQTLNQELRGIYEAMRQEMLLPSEQIVMTGGAIDIDIPLNELLYEIYKGTIERHRDFFEPILKITTFEPMADDDLTADLKRDLSRFLEEILLNVYRHAKSPTQLTIMCSQEDDCNVIRVVDNGIAVQNSKLKKREGYGTKQAKKLARSLHGKFDRIAVQPQGTACELSWPTQRSTQKRWFKQ